MFHKSLAPLLSCSRATRARCNVQSCNWQGQQFTSASSPTDTRTVHTLQRRPQALCYSHSLQSDHGAHAFPRNNICAAVGVRCPNTCSRGAFSFCVISTPPFRARIFCLLRTTKVVDMHHNVRRVVRRHHRRAPSFNSSLSTQRQRTNAKRLPPINSANIHNTNNNICTRIIPRSHNSKLQFGSRTDACASSTATNNCHTPHHTTLKQR
jgi:hypothetical protein